MTFCFIWMVLTWNRCSLWFQWKSTPPWYTTSSQDCCRADRLVTIWEWSSVSDCRFFVPPRWDVSRQHWCTDGIMGIRYSEAWLAGSLHLIQAYVLEHWCDSTRWCTMEVLHCQLYWGSSGQWSILEVSKIWGLVSGSWGDHDPDTWQPSMASSIMCLILVSTNLGNSIGVTSYLAIMHGVIVWVQFNHLHPRHVSDICHFSRIKSMKRIPPLKGPSLLAVTRQLSLLQLAMSSTTPSTFLVATCSTQ